MGFLRFRTGSGNLLTAVVALALRLDLVFVGHGDIISQLHDVCKAAGENS